MNTTLNPYFNFAGNTKEAMEFYQFVLGGTLTFTTYGEGGMPVSAGGREKIMHAMLVSENGMTLMASDLPDGMPYLPSTAISISLSGSDEATLQNYWTKLSSRAEINEALNKAPWGDTFGMLTDNYGVRWMVNILGTKAK